MTAAASDLRAAAGRVGASLVARRSFVAPAARELSRAIHACAEVAFDEVDSAELLARYAQAHGADVVRGLGSLPTAVSATVGSGPRVALLAEYDALPGLGHACGHNLVAGAAATAFALLAPVVDDLGLSVTLFGTPAEESGAGKTVMLREGAFDGVRAVLMAHPGPVDSPEPATAALSRRTVRFGGGDQRHVAVSAGDSVSSAAALARCALAFAASRLPAGTTCHFSETSVVATNARHVTSADIAGVVSVRGSAEADVAIGLRVVEDCCRAAAQALDVSVRLDADEPDLVPVIHDPELAKSWRRHHRFLGHEAHPSPVPVATDCGLLSRSIPTIHPFFGIGSWPVANHEPAFAACALSSKAERAMADAGTALALTVVDYAFRHVDSSPGEHHLDPTSGME